MGRASVRRGKSFKDSSKRDEPFLRLVDDIGSKKHSIKKKVFSPKTDAQKRYDTAIKSKDIVFGYGPAGTGKTWYAAMCAAQALENKEIEKIIVTRPAVEAGEQLGFMPGEMEEKYEPYFRPVKDAFEEYFGKGHLEYLIKAKIIEARPLAFLRGSSIKDSWLIADEMQNSTITQMKMLLSRIDKNAKFIVNGDPDQIDLPSHTKSGLLDAIGRVGLIEEISCVRFTDADIVRSNLCQKIVRAYSTK